MSNVALIGLGRMGTPICAKLVEAGHTVYAHDTRPACEGAASRAGAAWRDSARAAAGGADVLVTVLPDATAVEQAVDADVLGALSPGSAWVDMTSAAPPSADAVRTLADAHGVAVVDAPMAGGPEDAAAGSLQLFVGGDAEAVARVRPLLDAVADPRHVKRVGGHGAGYTVKLLVNLLWFGQAVATAEALLIGSRAGIDLTLLRDVLGNSAAGSDFIRHDLTALFTGDYLASYGLDRIRTQLAAITSYADRLGTPHDVADTVLRLHEEALGRYGPVDGELLGVALLEERARLRLRP